MPRKIAWTDAKYSAALKNDPDSLGLRSLVNGFDASNGYDLRKISSWTPYQKSKIRDYYERVQKLESQEKIIVRPRNKKILERLKNSFHGDIKTKNFKVAFVPHVTPKMTGNKKAPRPKISYTKTQIVIDAGVYKKYYEAFDVYNLAVMPALEIERAISTLKKATLYYIQAGEHHGITGITGEKAFVRYIEKLMLKYDGTGTSQQQNSAWWLWLHGMNGYDIGKRNIDKMRKDISDGMATAKKKRTAKSRKLNKTK